MAGAFSLIIAVVMVILAGFAEFAGDPWEFYAFLCIANLLIAIAARER